MLHGVTLLAWAGILVGLVGVVQSVAWLGGRRVGARRRRQGSVLAPVSLAAMLLSLLHVLVPGFW
jgi:hypothetical protein